MHKTIPAALVSLGMTLLAGGGCAPAKSTDSPKVANKQDEVLARPVTYHNKSYGFKFTIPAGWKKQSGDPDSDGVLFMQVPITNSCSFQYHVSPMQKEFPAEAAVKASLEAARADIDNGKNLSAKRRDDRGTLGWELVEKGRRGGHQRIIYQLYDEKNRYFNLMTVASTEKFEACRPEFRKIIDSIKFD